MIVVNLDRLLSERKMHSTDLAESLDCTVQTISRIKNGRVRAFRLSTLDSICKELGCQPGDVIEYIPEEEAVKRYGRDFVARYKKFHVDS